MIDRAPIRFARWNPVLRDYGISYEYVIPEGLMSAGRTYRAGSDKWMRAKSRIASSAIATGCDTFLVDGGLGNRRWKRVVTVTQDEAEAYFFDQIHNHRNFMLKGVLRKALTTRERRLARTTTKGE